MTPEERAVLAAAEAWWHTRHSSREWRGGDPWEEVQNAIGHMVNAREREGRARCGTPGGFFESMGPLSQSSRRSGKPPVPNRYPGKCYVCGTPVAAGAGCIGKENGQWVVFC